MPNNHNYLIFKGFFGAVSVFNLMINLLIFGLILPVFTSLSISSVCYAVLDENENGLSDIWEQRINASSLNLFDDDDGDSFSNLEECVAGTDPFDSSDLPELGLVVDQGNSDIVQLGFQSINGKYYTLEGSRDLSVFEDPFSVNGSANLGFI